MCLSQKFTFIATVSKKENIHTFFLSSKETGERFVNKLIHKQVIAFYSSYSDWLAAILLRSRLFRSVVAAVKVVWVDIKFYFYNNEKRRTLHF